MRRLFCSTLLVVSAVLAGCASGHRDYPANPQYGDPLQGLVQPGQLQMSRAAISGASGKKLALVRSANVESALRYNAAVLDWRRWATATYINVDQQQLLNQIAEQVSTDKLFLESLLTPLRSSFKEVVLAADVVDGFEKGADYVGIFDLQSSLTDRMSKLMPGPLDWDNVSRVSVVFVDRQLVAGPDVRVDVVTKTYETPQGAHANTRIALGKMQENRVGTVSEFDKRVRAVVKP